MDNNSTLLNRHETLFLWEVRKSNPNGDPNGNEPRIDRYTKKCHVTDVCIKRSVRNHIAVTKGIDALLMTKLGEDVSETKTVTKRIEDYLFGNQEKTEKVVTEVKKIIGNKYSESEKPYKDFLEKPSAATLIKLINKKDKSGEEPIKNILVKNIRAYLCGAFSDLRMFGSVLALESPLKELGGPLTGPIQIEIATSLHRVVQSNKQITSIMGSKEEKTAGIIGDTHCIEYGLFATSAIANENSAKFTGLTDNEHNLFLKALWRGTRDRHTRSKNQVPRLLINITYKKPFHFGDLVDLIQLNPIEKNGKKLEEEAYREIQDFTVDLTKFYNKLNSKKEAISSIKFVSNDLIKFEDFKKGIENNFNATEIKDIDFDKE